MFLSELLTLIAQGEGAKLEFKRDDGLRPETLAKEIVAFANMNGGRILIGVEDDGTTPGVQRLDMQRWLMDTVVRRYVSPPILVDYEEVAVDEQKIAVISVPMGSAKPYSLQHNDRMDFYVRRGNTCQLAQREEILRLYESGGLLSIEKMPVDGCLPNELDNFRVKDYLTNVYSITGEEWQDDRERFLLNHNFIKPVEHTNKVCATYFACAFFISKPRRFLPQAGVRIIVYKNKRDAQARDVVIDEILDIPFLGADEDTPLCDVAELYIKPHISREVLDAEESYARETVWDYPPSVTRELLVNAFAHRDWIKQNQIEITIYSDCMEITSPGALPNGMTVEKMQAGERTPRNNKIIDILRDTGFVESRGMGIRRRVIPDMKQHNGCEPIFEATEDYVRVILPKKSD